MKNYPVYLDYTSHLMGKTIRLGEYPICPGIGEWIPYPNSHTRATSDPSLLLLFVIDTLYKANDPLQTEEWTPTYPPDARNYHIAVAVESHPAMESFLERLVAQAVHAPGG